VPQAWLSRSPGRLRSLCRHQGRVYSRSRGSYLMVTLPGLETGTV